MQNFQSTGSSYINRSAPDGYKLLLARVGSQAVGPALNTTLPYKYDDFTMLGLLEINPFGFAVNADSRYKTFDDLVKAPKKNPGKLSYSTSGPGTVLNMGPQVLLQAIGLPSSAATQVPYKGGGGAVTALLGSHVDFIGVNLSAALKRYHRNVSILFRPRRQCAQGRHVYRRLQVRRRGNPIIGLNQSPRLGEPRYTG